jgi:hypothetical protein
MNFPIPYVNPDIKHVGVSTMRQMDSQFLRDLKHPIVIGIDKPLAVLIPYQVFMEIQKEMVR